MDLNRATGGLIAALGGVSIAISKVPCHLNAWACSCGYRGEPLDEHNCVGLILAFRYNHVCILSGC